MSQNEENVFHATSMKNDTAVSTEVAPQKLTDITKC